jgi:glutaredoxin-like YruB-family protein
MQVVIYTTPTCGYCRQAKEFLSRNRIPFIEKDVSQDSVAAYEMVQVSGQRGVPVVTVDGQVVVGFDRPRLERLLAASAAGRPSLGLKVADASRITMKLGGVPVFGAYVGWVAPGSPGARAGLREGDIVTELNLRPVRNAGDLETAASALAPGSRVSLVFVRGAQTLRAEIGL